ncbi:MAG: hypothetical protein NDJ90_15700 [Oligoflexia bacterium]|nr:hypothetical protein [Oligoflexia bacterium]
MLLAGTRWTICILLLSSVITGPKVGASEIDGAYFKNTRFDPSVPENCRKLELQHFSEVAEIVLVGLAGARKERFSHEYPLEREDANTLWLALSSRGAASDELMSSIHSNRELRRLYELLLEIGPQMGFNFEKEGDVLEALALHMLKSDFPDGQFFLTGGVAYGERSRNAVYGELDIIAARRSDCKVVAIGETKLGVTQAKHARNQLKRFLDFVRPKLCRGADGAPVCAIQ